MNKWQICRIDYEYLQKKHDFQYVAYVFTENGREIIKKSPVFDQRETDLWLENFIATLADDGWEPMPIFVPSSPGRMVWYFKRLK